MHGCRFAPAIDQIDLEFRMKVRSSIEGAQGAPTTIRGTA
jgi:hypothetical protein